MYVYICCYIIFFTNDNEIPSPTGRYAITERRSMKNLYITYEDIFIYIIYEDNRHTITELNMKNLYVLS